jgi:hypothetical protein
MSSTQPRSLFGTPLLSLYTQELYVTFLMQYYKANNTLMLKTNLPSLTSASFLPSFKSFCFVFPQEIFEIYKILQKWNIFA